jgi:aspartyl-tRNA(Asn)/glutamyl-tRNA(Gln) amidotransferase subunit C
VRADYKICPKNIFIKIFWLNVEKYCYIILFVMIFNKSGGSDIMSISKEEIEHVAKLARLNLSEHEVEKYTKEMSNLIDFVNKLNELDTNGVESTANAIKMQNVFREDKVEKSFERDSILKNAPLKEAGCFRVPKVVD